MLFYHLLKIFIRHIHSCLMIPISVTPNVAKASSCSIGLASGASIGLSSSTSCSSSVANTHSGGFGCLTDGKSSYSSSSHSHKVINPHYLIMA
jgi:hypothetical protein